MEAADPATYAFLLRNCGEAKALSDGKRVHALICKFGCEKSVFLGSLLVDIYCKCEELEEGRTLFDYLNRRDAFCWNVMMAAYARNGQGSDALRLFDQMRSEMVVPNKFTFVSVLSACTSHSTLVVGEKMHACIVNYGFECDVVVGTALVNMYSKCGDLEAARTIFDKMRTRSVVSWTAMMAACAQHGQGEAAIQLFNLMQHQGEMPNKVTFTTLLDACSQLGALVEGVCLLARIVGSEIESDVVVGTALVNMYSKCSKLQDAQEIFDKMPDRNVISWNAMIAAYAQHGKGTLAFQLFHQMQQKQIKPSKATFVSILAACAGLTALDEGEDVHAQIMGCGYESDIVVATALVNMYGKCGSLDKAQRLFENMLERNVVAWNSMIAVYSEHGRVKQVLQLFHQMLLEGITPCKVTFITTLDLLARLMALAEGKRMHAQIVARGFQSDVVVGTSLINMYGKCGNLEDARTLFDEIPEKNVITWGAMIGAYAQHEQGKEALQFFDRMCHEKLELDMITYINLIDACASMATLDEGEQLHAGAVNSGYESDVVVATALVNMYSKCGILVAARRVFDKMFMRNVVSWNAMIAAYAQHGLGKKAVKLFHQMQAAGERPNEVTFVCLLSACSHTGLVKEGCYYFLNMSQDYGIAGLLDHYNCMIDLLGRAGLLNEAEGLLYIMPYPPTVVTWMTLLGACINPIDVQRGECAASWVFQLNPENVTPLVMLNNIYSWMA